jgi:hypothetical protein
MTGESVDGDLAAAMVDPDVAVRRAAVGTLAFRSITPLLPAVTRVLQGDPDVTVRLSIVSAMALRRQQDPGVLSDLRWAAAHDTDPSVRQAAQGALSSP